MITFNEQEKQTKEYQQLYNVYLSAQADEIRLSKELQKEQERLNGLRRQQQQIIVAPDSYRLKEAPKPLEVTSLELKPTELTIDTTKLPEVELPVKIKPLDGELAAQKFLTEFADSLSAIAPTVNAFAGLTQSIFAAETQAMEEEKAKQLIIAGDDAKRREQIEREYAIKRAKLAREQAVADKSFAYFNAVVNIASAISKTIADNGMPAAIPFIALAAATGAAQIAAIAAAPLPSIPQFEDGGFVDKAKALSGGRIAPSGLIWGRSHRQGGVLIEAEGNEFIAKGAATAKYSEELVAANNLRLEDLILHKYVVPAIEQQRAKARSGNSIVVNNEWDDGLLRKTIRDTSERSANLIAKEVGKTVSEALESQRKHR